MFNGIKRAVEKHWKGTMVFWEEILDCNSPWAAAIISGEVKSALESQWRNQKSMNNNNTNDVKTK